MHLVATRRQLAWISAHRRASWSRKSAKGDKRAAGVDGVVVGRHRPALRWQAATSTDRAAAAGYFLARTTPAPSPSNRPSAERLMPNRPLIATSTTRVAPQLGGRARSAAMTLLARRVLLEDVPFATSTDRSASYLSRSVIRSLLRSR